jgi:MFS family permease
MGAATGVLATAGSVAAPLASLVAGGLSDRYGPRVIFAVMAVMVSLAALLLLRVQVPQGTADDSVDSKLKTQPPPLSGESRATAD